MNMIRHHNCRPDANPSWKHIGIVGGTFDPPHYGHVTLIQAAQNHLKCDLVVVRPCNGNPLKSMAQGEFQHRVNMCQMMFGAMENVLVSDFESQLPYPTHSYLTVKSMFENEWFGNAYYHFMIGEDCLANIEHWMNLGQLFVYSDLYAVGPNVASIYNNLPAYIRRNTGYIQMDSVTDIHSTQIRNQIAEGVYSPEYTSPDVLEYVRNHGMYR